MNTNDRSERERRLDEVATAYLQEIERGHAPQPAEWLRRYPDLAEELAAFFAAQDQVAQLAAPLRLAEPSPVAATQGSTAPPQGLLGTVRYVGDYELLEEIARGGMGVVYRARQTKLDRIVAVKMILAGELANPSDVERFHTEARAAAQLHHPNIVAIHEVGQHQGQHYFSMDYVAGESLANRIARGPLPPGEAATLLVKVARAVAFAHVDGVIHRDLKPANILLDASGEPHVTDFGLAKRVHSQPEAATIGGLTETGQVLGTPSYMPPEQAAGRTKDIGPRSDVYALGAVLYCALTGRPPFQAASTLDTLLQVLDREPVSPRALNPAVSRDLETICLKCLDKEPRHRYASAQELADELQRVLDGKPILARPISRAGRAWRWCRRNPVVAAMSAALVLAITAGVVTSILFAMQAHDFGVRAHKEAVTSAELTVKAKDLATQKELEAERANAQERLTRRYLYTAHMNLVQDALKSGNLLHAVELLNKHRPSSDHEDLRSFEWDYLWRECYRERKTFSLTAGTTGGSRNVYGSLAVTEIAISPNNKWAALGIWGADQLDVEVRLVDLTTGALRKTIAGEIDRKQSRPGSPIRDRAFRHPVFSADSKLFAVVAWDYPRRQSPRLEVWDLDTLEPRATIPLGSFQVRDRIAIAPTTAAAGYCNPDKRSCTIKVWDLPKRKNLKVGPERILLHRERVGGTGHDPFTCFTFTPDGKELACNNQESSGLIFTSLSDGKQRTLPLGANYHAFSPDGKYFADWSGKKTVKLYDVAMGKAIHDFPADAMSRSRSHFWNNFWNLSDTICFSPDSRILAFGHGLSVSLWDVQTKQQLGLVRWPIAPVRALGFGADSRTLITVAENNEAKVWDINTRPGPEEWVIGPGIRRERMIVPAGIDHDKIAGLAIAPDGKTLAVVYTSFGIILSDIRTVRLYDLAAGSLGTQVAELKWDTPKNFRPSTVTFSPDGKWLALSGPGENQGWRREQNLQLWRIAREPTTRTTLKRTFFTPQSDHPWERSPLAAFSPDGAWFAYTACRLTFDSKYGWESRSADHVYVHDFAAGPTRQLPADPQARFPGVPDWLLRRDKDAARCWCGGVVFSSDGKRIFSAHRDYNDERCWIVVWDTATGTLSSVLPVPIDLGSTAQALALSPDNRTLASCHKDEIRLWDVSEPALRQVREKLQQQAREVESGKVQASTKPAAEPKAILHGHSDLITAITFHPDGKTLASASNDGTIKIWDVITGETRLTLEGQMAGQVMTNGTVTRPAALAFTPDGHTLMYGTNTGILKVWRGAAAPGRDVK